MTESQLKLGNNLTKDREVVYDQMKIMKDLIGQASRRSYNTDDPKEDFDTFKQSLLNQCDEWVVLQRKKLDDKFAKI